METTLAVLERQPVKSEGGTGDNEVHLARAPYTQALCGYVRKVPIYTTGRSPSCIVCLEMYKDQTGKNW